MTTSEDVRGLDAYQRAAVAHGDGPAIVRAGPGSGKTTVIVERAVRLIDERLARPEQLLVLTFSRKAAGELRQRIADRLRRSYASFPITTFHGFCYSLLLRHAPAEPRLAAPAERREAMTQALAEAGNLDLRPTRGLVEEALAFAALCDEYLTTVDHDLTPVREAYSEGLAAAGLLDFGAMQREAVAFLEDHPDVRRGYAGTFRHVLVDEYQDTNVAQDRLLELIAGEHRNVFVVADEDQSIYGFRGAEIDNALGFEERWPGAATYELPANYRSAPRVVDLATSLIRRNVDTHRQKPLAAAHERPAELVGRTFRHAAEEADWIAREIAALRLEGAALGSVAVLARSLRDVGPRLAYALRRHGVPFHAPLSPPLHSTARALLSILELAHSERWDDVQAEEALDVLASPLFGADPLALRRFRRTGHTVYGALRDSHEFEPFFSALGIVRRQTRAGAAVYALWERLEYFRELQRRCRPLDAPHQHVEELEALTTLSGAANDSDEGPAEFAAAYRQGRFAADELLPAGPLPQDAVAVLTVHGAKGLEWDAVFVCDLVEGRFPALARSQHSLFDRDAFARTPLDEAARARRSLEEERRLFYVAVTRARTRVYLSATEEPRQEGSRSISRFLLEAQDFLAPAPEREGCVSSEEALTALRRAGGGPPGWHARAETRNETPMLEGALWTSATGLSPYENCPWQYYLSSLLELVRPRGAALVFGGVFHDVLEAFHDPEQPGPLTRERLLALAAEKWRPGRISPAPLEREHRRKLDRMLEDYYAHEIEPGLDAEVLAVEHRFRLELDSATLSGRIDRIDRRPDGRLRLVDYKSGKEMSIEKAEEDLQLALYALACSSVPELAELGEVAEIEYLFPARVVYGRVLRRAQTVTPELADRTRARILELLGRIRSEQFDFSPEAQCRFCELKSICPRHHGRDAPV